MTFKLPSDEVLRKCFSLLILDDWKQLIEQFDKDVASAKELRNISATKKNKG